MIVLYIELAILGIMALAWFVVTSREKRKLKQAANPDPFLAMMERDLERRKKRSKKADSIYEKYNDLKRQYEIAKKQRLGFTDLAHEQKIKSTHIEWVRAMVAPIF